jgi:hypothetical protein
VAPGNGRLQIIRAALAECFDNLDRQSEQQADIHLWFHLAYSRSGTSHECTASQSAFTASVFSSESP